MKTPSPHRFKPGQARKPAPSNDPIRPSVPTQQDATPRKDATPSQFAQTPRFSFGRPSRAVSPPKSSLAQALRAATRPAEAVEETYIDEAGQDDEMLEIEHVNDAVPTTESTQQRHDEWVNELPYSPKRRRLDTQEALAATDSPAKPIFKHPSTPASHISTGAYQFARAGSVAGTIKDDSSHARRPAFLRPALAAPEQLEPLPEAFSPHRRGERFVPGGMAATLQQWVVETGQSAAHSRKEQGYLGGDDYVLRVRVGMVNKSSGPVFVRGNQPDGSEVNLLLVVGARHEGMHVELGSVVGVRAPTWEVVVQGDVWAVGVDWKVLKA